MTTQPEALRLADEFDWWVARGLNLEPRLADAAEELRRLHEVEKQRDELLAALKDLINCADPHLDWAEIKAARAAIAKASTSN